MNPIREYYKLIKENKVKVSRKIKVTYKKLVYDLDHEGLYFYSEKRANHAIDFIEKYCKHSKGKMGGKPVYLELWEKAMLAAIFGFIDIEDNRKYREAVLIIGKKNGKSLIASAVGNYLLIADGEPGPEVYAVATKKDQSKIIWSESVRMRNKSPALRKRTKALVGELKCEFNDGSFKPLASDTNTLDGLNVHGALMDEIHQWTNGKALYDIIADGVSAREQPLIFITSTAGTVREDLYDLKYEEAERVINGYEDPDGYKDDRFIAFIYELDSRAEWIDEKCWYKANPGLGTIKNLGTLREKVNRAKSNSLLVKNLVCKEFNIRETSDQAWLTFEQIDNQETFDIATLKPRYGIGGADLSVTTDLTAAKVLFMIPNNPKIYVLQMYWLPEDLLEKRSKEDQIPYDIWRDQGLLRTTPGNSVHHTFVTQWFEEVMNDMDIYLPWIGYDGWSAKYWVEEMKGIFGNDAMIPVIQGKKTLSGPMHLLGADLDRKNLIYNNNSIDKWCLSNTHVDIDKNANIQPAKSKSQRKRIDGTAALLDAYVILQNKMAEYQNMI